MNYFAVAVSPVPSYHSLQFVTLKLKIVQVSIGFEPGSHGIHYGQKPAHVYITFVVQVNGHVTPHWTWRDRFTEGLHGLVRMVK